MTICTKRMSIRFTFYAAIMSSTGSGSPLPCEYTVRVIYSVVYTGKEKELVMDYTFDLDNGPRVANNDSNIVWDFAIAVGGLLLSFALWNWFRYILITGRSSRNKYSAFRVLEAPSTYITPRTILLTTFA